MWCAAVTKIFALIDCNSFYCSCEQAFQPSLRGKPIVVLSNNDGCAVARTPEAKDLGIKMGEPAFKIKNDPLKKHTIMFSSNYTLYGDMSQRVQDVVEEFVPEFEIYSIDELFLSLDGLEHHGLEKYMGELKKAVLKWVGIPTCVGIGPTKTLAKIANDIAKKNSQLKGVFSLLDIGIRNEILSKYPVEDIWGVGRATAQKLHNIGIVTAANMRDMPIKQARKIGTVIVERIINELNGISSIPLEDAPPTRKGTAVTRSFGKPVTTYDGMKEAILTHCARGGEKLRSQGLVAGRISIFINTSKYRQTRQYYNKASVAISPMTDDTAILINEAVQLLDKIFLNGIEYGKAGIFLDDLCLEAEKPLHLFVEDNPKKKELMAALDKINQTHGKQSIQYAGAGITKKWQTRAESRSPRYTTKIKEVPIAYAH